jgi:hypothetical protein
MLGNNNTDIPITPLKKCLRKSKPFPAMIPQAVQTAFLCKKAEKKTRRSGVLLWQYSRKVFSGKTPAFDSVYTIFTFIIDPRITSTPFAIPIASARLLYHSQS